MLGFANNLEQADIAGHLGVRAAAKFHADVWNRNDANLLLILFAEKSERAAAIASLISMTSCLDRQVLEDDAD